MHLSWAYGAELWECACVCLCAGGLGGKHVGSLKS